MHFHRQIRKYWCLLVLWVCCSSVCGCPSAPPPEQPQPVNQPESSDSATQEPAPELPAERPGEESSDPSMENASDATPGESAVPTVPQSTPGSSPPGNDAKSEDLGSSLKDHAATLNKAKSLLASARAKGKTGNHSGAFRDARDAWNLVQGSQDPLLQNLAQEIRKEMDASAARISESSKEPPSQFRVLILE
jgi:hypothetical protein